MDNKKLTKKLTIRLDEDTYNLMKKKVDELGITQSDYFRQLIVKGRTTKKCKYILQLILQLSKIGNNINQIAKNLNIAKKENALNEVDYNNLLNQLGQINFYLKKLLNDY